MLALMLERNILISMASSTPSISNNTAVKIQMVLIGRSKSDTSPVQFLLLLCSFLQKSFQKVYFHSCLIFWNSFSHLGNPGSDTGFWLIHRCHCLCQCWLSVNTAYGMKGWQTRVYHSLAKFSYLYKIMLRPIHTTILAFSNIFP